MTVTQDVLLNEQPAEKMSHCTVGVCVWRQRSGMTRLTEAVKAFTISGEPFDLGPLAYPPETPRNPASQEACLALRVFDMLTACPSWVVVHVCVVQVTFFYY